MLRGIRTFVRRAALAIATAIFLLSVGLAIYIYLGGEWSTVAAALDRGRAYIPEVSVPDGDDVTAVRTKVADWIAPDADSVAAETVETVADDGIQLFFSPVDEARTDGPDDQLIALIRSAKRSVYAAFFELSYEPVAEALIDRHRAGIEVRLVSDSDYKKRDAVRACEAAGIPVEFDKRGAFMHNKFCVVDNEWVWTGSTNITRNGFFSNNNNALLFRSPIAAEDYAAEFTEMFAARSFGGRSPRNTPQHEFVLGANTIEVYFAPEDGVEREIRAEIGEADKAIVFMAFSFTSRPIAEAMAGRMKQGVKVRGLLETRGAGLWYCRDDFLRERGATVYLDNNPRTMHNKVIVIDADTVITGSYNFSKSAEKENDENVLIVHSPTVAAGFIQEFDRLTAAH